MLANFIKSQKYAYKRAGIVTVLLICNSLFSCTNGKQLLAMQREAYQTQQARLIDPEQQDSESIEMVQLETSSFTRLVSNNAVNLDQVEEKNICPKCLKWIGGTTLLAIVCGTSAYYYYFHDLDINSNNIKLIQPKEQYLNDIKEFLDQNFPNTTKLVNSGTISKSMS